MHLAASRSEGVSIVKYLLREHKDICIPMLLAKDCRDYIPLENSEAVKVGDAPTCLCQSSSLYYLIQFRAESSLAHAKSAAESSIRRTNFSKYTQNNIKEQQTRWQRVGMCLDIHMHGGYILLSSLESS